MASRIVDRFRRLGAFLKHAMLGREDEDIRPVTARQRFLHWFGIHVPSHKKDRVHIRPRFFRILWLGLLGILVLFVCLFEYSTSPRFCNSCHIMTPYYKAWKTSRHNFVACVECHYPPGTKSELRMKFQAMSQVVKYVTRTYGSKPYAEVADASCLRPGCHETRLLEGKVTFKRGIIFDHRPHLTQPRRGRRLRCTSCHSQIVVGTHMVVTESTCFLCHFKGKVHGREEFPLAGCPSCHESPSVSVKVGGITFSHEEFVGKQHVSCQNCHLDAIRGDGRAPKERCMACHNEPEKLKEIQDLPSLHDNHVTLHDVACSRCHEEIVHAVRTTIKPLEYGCDVCHENKHSAQKEMFMGTGGKDFPGIPSHMFVAQVDCIACHMQPLFSNEKVEFIGQTYVASQKACIKCHGKQYDGLLHLWQQTFDAMLKEIKPKLAATVALSSQKATRDHRTGALVDSLVADARHNVDFVELARGVHNVFYAAGLLHVANENLDMATKTLGGNPRALGKHSFLGGDYCAVLCHSKVGVKMPEVVNVFGRSLPHRRHFFQYDVPCTRCHSAEHHKEVDVKPQDCSNCHHSASTDKCGDCHKLEASLYNGSFMSNVTGEKLPSLMSGAVSCRDCHKDVGPRRTAELVANACETCHEKGYKDTLKDWTNEMTNLHEETSRKLALVRNSLEKEKKMEYLSDAERAKLERAGKIVSSLAPRVSVHNTALSEQLLKKALEDLGDVETKTGSHR